RFKRFLKLNGDLQRDRPILILIAALAIFCPPTSPSERSPRPYVNGIVLKRALRSVPSRYPSATSGLCAKEMQLLHQVHSHAPNVVRVIGNALAADYDAADGGTGGLDQVGDSWLFSRILRLGDSSLREPALEITGSRLQYRDTSARLTPFGERILDGRANFLERNGIDEWVAGVHLQSEAGRVWLEREGDVIRR
ncbi:MAG TPA: hypothetical protein VFG23_12945, partial [Polyangia bacterium]|nr:hypothetical protein [Polyangia bacterium]